MTTLPAQRLKMGSTTYFLASMPVRELVMVVKPASEALADSSEISISADSTKKWFHISQRTQTGSLDQSSSLLMGGRWNSRHSLN